MDAKLIHNFNSKILIYLVIMVSDLFKKLLDIRLVINASFILQEKIGNIDQLYVLHTV